jgi:hypothetical protein
MRKIEEKICQACGRPIKSEKVPCPFIALRGGKIIIMYWAFIHRSCLNPYWRKQIKESLKGGWIIPAGLGKYEPAPKYRGDGAAQEIPATPPV